MLEKPKKLKWGYIILGGMLTVIGLCFLFFTNSLVALTITIGVILAIFGITLGALSIASRKRGFSFAISITLASICFIGGIITAILNKSATEILIAALCLIIIVDGSFKFHTSAMAKRHSVDGWWIMTIIASLVILSSFGLVKFTPDSTKAATIWLGITVLVDAVANFFSTVFTTKCRTAERAEIYYEVYKEIKGSDEKQ